MVDVPSHQSACNRESHVPTIDVPSRQAEVDMVHGTELGVLDGIENQISPKSTTSPDDQYHQHVYSNRAIVAYQSCEFPHILSTGHIGVIAKMGTHVRLQHKISPLSVSFETYTKMTKATGLILRTRQFR